MTMKLEGFDKLQRKLQQLGDRAKALPGRVTGEDLLTPAFMQAHTRYQSGDEWLAASPVEITSAEDLTTAPWDAYVRTSTHFASWEAMLAAATKEMIKITTVPVAVFSRPPN